MKMKLFILVFLVFNSCSQNTSLEPIQEEIIATEIAFAKMAREVGLKEAFLEFAADSAVLNRNGKIIKGKQQIAAYFDSQTLQNVSLEWEPEFVEVARAGDMAYTYGPFIFSAISAEGEPQSALGYFHTVWKKQEDGSWKFIYD
jgi:ketosteroid isomerase-like protein